MVYMDVDVRFETSSASKSESDGYYSYIFNLLIKPGFKYVEPS